MEKKRKSPSPGGPWGVFLWSWGEESGGRGEERRGVIEFREAIIYFSQCYREDADPKQGETAH